MSACRSTTGASGARRGRGRACSRVGVGDRAPVPPPATPKAPRRILLLRLERIGDLLMALPGDRRCPPLAPDARSIWSSEAGTQIWPRAIPGINRVESLDAPGWRARARVWICRRCCAHAAGWRARSYDLAINFEPDIRSNLLLAAAGARMDRWLSQRRRRAAAGRSARLRPAIAHQRQRAAAGRGVFGVAATPTRRGVTRNPGGAPAARPHHSRHGDTAHRRRACQRRAAVKQWDPDRFADVARRLARRAGATIVLTGSAGDRPLVDASKRAAPDRPRHRRCRRSRPADARSLARRSRSAHHRRHRADAPRGCGRHADRRGVRSVGPAALRAARTASTRSFGSTFRARRATGSGCRPRDARAEPRLPRARAVRNACSTRRSPSSTSAFPRRQARDASA